MPELAIHEFEKLSIDPFGTLMEGEEPYPDKRIAKLFYENLERNKDGKIQIRLGRSTEILKSELDTYRFIKTIFNEKGQTSLISLAEKKYFVEEFNFKGDSEGFILGFEKSNQEKIAFTRTGLSEIQAFIIESEEGFFLKWPHGFKQKLSFLNKAFRSL